MAATATDTRPLRLLYVEDDPALRCLLAERLLGSDDVAQVDVAADATEALDRVREGGIDAVLLDVSLGVGRLNGFELGLALRANQPDMALVMYSQHPAGRIDDVLPEAEQHHWSYMQKRGKLDVDDIVSVIRMTVRGISRFDMPDPQASRPAADVLRRLTPRQREVIALAATGLDARAISEQLHLAHVSVRRELSRAYKVLVPGAPSGTDLRTAAVLEYLRLTDQVGLGAA